jgi:hypothetical protein
MFQLTQEQCWFDMGWCVRASTLDWPSQDAPQEISLDGVTYTLSERVYPHDHTHIMSSGWHYWSAEAKTMLSVFD